MPEDLSVEELSRLLVEAVEQQDVQSVKQCLNGDAHVNSRNVQHYDNVTVLMMACENGNRAIAKLLLDKGASVNLPDNHSWTALIYAVVAGDFKLVRMLLKAGAYVDHQADGGLVALMHAAELGHVDIADLLIQEKAEVNKKEDTDSTALHHAAQYGQTDVVDLLLHNGADRTVVNKEGKTAIQLVQESKLGTAEGRARVVELLENYGKPHDPAASRLPGARSRLGPDGILHYQEALKEGKLNIIRINIDLVGEGGAGKSCIGDSLVDKPFEEGKASTIGAHIRVMRTAVGTKDNWEEAEGREREHTIKRFLAAGTIYKRRKQSSEVKEEQPKSSQQRDSKTQPSEQPSYQSRTLPTNTPSEEALPGGLVVQLDEFKDAGDATDEQAALIEFLEKNEEELRKCDQLILVTVFDRGGQEEFLTTHAALMADCSTHSSTVYVFANDLTKPLDGPATNVFRQDKGKTIRPRKRRAKTRADVLRQWVSAVDLAHPERIVRMGRGIVQWSPPMLFLGTHRDVIEKMLNGQELVDKQEKAIRDILIKHDYIKRVVPTVEKKILFKVDNARSGTGNPDPVIIEVKRLLYDMAEQYLTNKENWTEGIGAETPLSWTVVEIALMRVAEREQNKGKMMDIHELFRLARRYCKTLDRFKSALKYLFSFGVIVWWFDVAGLKDTIFTDPQWLFDVMSTYVSVLGDHNVPFHLLSDLAKLKENGHMTRALAEGLLQHSNLGVKRENYNKIFRVLQLVDIFCPALSDYSPRKLAIEDAKEFYVPCMLENDFEEETAWEQSGAGNAVGQRNSSECQPPSLIIKPSNVDHFPEPLFFRLSARTAYECSNFPMLKRNRIEVHLPGDLELELLYHHSTCCVIATVFPTKKQQIPNRDVINKQCVWVRRFLCWQLSDCKRRGINGFEYKLYFQFDKKVGQMDMEEKSLYEIPVGDQMREAITNKHGRLTKADCKSVMLWYCSKAQNDGASGEASSQLPDLHDIAKYIGDRWRELAHALEPRPFYKNEWVNFEDVTDQSEDREALRMLQAWKGEHKNQATAGHLKQALTDAGLQHVANKLWKQSSPSGKVTPDKFIQVVTNLGHHKAYLFGTTLLPRHPAELDAIIHDHPNCESQLRAIIDKARDRHGDKKTMDILLAACDQLGILGGVKDELGIEGEIVFEDISHTSNTPPPKDDYVKGETLADMRSKADSITEPRNLVLVARTIDDKWEECASILDPEEILFTEEKIEEISKQNKSQFLKAKMILKEWSRHFKETATNRMLIEALCDMRFTKEASEVFGDELVEFIQQNRST